MRLAKVCFKVRDLSAGVGGRMTAKYAGPTAPSRFHPLSRRAAAGVAVSLGVLAQAGELQASEGWVRFLDVTNPYASLAYAYDSNLFRLDSDAPDIGSRSDRIATLSAGFDAKLPVSQQEFELSGVITRNFYDSHDDLDFTGGKGAAVWHWRAGRVWTGNLGYRYARSLRDFANQFTTEKTEGVRNDHRIFGDTTIDLPGKWKLGARGEFADIAITSTDLLDLQRTTGGTTLSYVSASGNVIGLDAQVSDGKYDNNPVADFKEYNIGPTLDWQLRPSTRVNAKIGYSSRNNNDSFRADFEDFTGRVVFTMTSARRHKLTATVWREISNLGDEIADFALIHGVSLEPRWQLSNGVAIRLLGSYQARDFKVSDPALDRQDDVFTGGVFTDWPIGRNLKLSVGVDAERRSSTRTLQDYDFVTAQVQITGKL